MPAFRSVQQGNQGVEFGQGTLVVPDPTSDRKSSQLFEAKHLMTA
jgi:hypothetical protein